MWIWVNTGSEYYLSRVYSLDKTILEIIILFMLTNLKRLSLNTASLATELGETLSDEKYSSFAHFVDVTKIFSDASSFEDVDGTPDYLHPGYSAYAKMANAVLERLGVE